MRAQADKCKRCGETVKQTAKRAWEMRNNGQKNVFCSRSCSALYSRGGWKTGKRKKQQTEVLVIRRDKRYSV
jgi:hypothetical protein